MVETVSVRYDFGGADGGAGATHQDIDTLGPPRLKFKLADNATIDEANPVYKPVAGGGETFSWWKHIYLYCDDPDGGSISNVKFYNDSGNSYPTGVVVYVSNVLAHSSTDETKYEVADTALTMVANHTQVATATNVTTYTSTSPLAVTISEAGAEMNAAGEMSGYIVLQAGVSSTASAQTTAQWQWYFSYDYTP